MQSESCNRPPIIQTGHEAWRAILDGQTFSATKVSAAAALVLAPLLLITAVVLFLFDPQTHSFYPACFFHRVTGLLCPGCGSLRALHQLLHGHVLTALRFNALLISYLPIIACWTVLCAVRRTRNQAVPSIRAWWLWTSLVLLLIFGIVRNLPFARAWLGP